jgi:hypothetical protein
MSNAVFPSHPSVQFSMMLALITSVQETGAGESYHTMLQLFKYSLIVKTFCALQALIIWKHLPMGTSGSSKIAWAM